MHPSKWSVYLLVTLVFREGKEEGMLLAEQ